MSRLLTIMGSGETAPTMVKVHRMLIERVGGPAVLLDTPYGFQENADDISAKAQDYFASSVGTPIGVARLRSASDDTLTQATAVARVREAAYVFAGPGSPTYALTQWASTPLPAAVADKLRRGGGVTFASAAALTLGVVTVPVYEVYKAGEPPVWRTGLDLLQEAGFSAAVIPHYDNAEGGHHDTRYCYLGERRLALMEASLPAGAFVLGVDEHTAAVLDLDAATVVVLGLGGVSVRVAGRSTVWPSGSVIGFDDIHAAAEGRSARAAAPPLSERNAGEQPPARSPLLAEADRLEAAHHAALATGNVPAAVSAILELEQLLVDWSADSLQSDEPDRVRATLRSMIVGLGEVAVDGARDPRAVVAPFVEALLELRRSAREAKDWATSDLVRDRLSASGVEVRDTPDGVEWLVTE